MGGVNARSAAKHTEAREHAANKDDFIPPMSVTLPPRIESNELGAPRVASPANNPFAVLLPSTGSRRLWRRASRVPILRAAPGDNAFEEIVADANRHARHQLAETDFRDPAVQLISCGRRHDSVYCRTMTQRPDQCQLRGLPLVTGRDELNGRIINTAKEYQTAASTHVAGPIRPHPFL
jgi:hypothetical protein